MRESFAKRREAYEEIITGIEKEHKPDRQLLLIIQLIEHIVNTIQNRSTIIDNARSNLSNKTFPNSEGIIEGKSYLY